MIHLLYSLLTILCSVNCYHGTIGPRNYFSSGLELNQPISIYSESGSLSASLEVSVLRHQEFISFNTRAFAYKNRGSIPGPTLHVKPGDTVSITIINNLVNNSHLIDDKTKSKKFFPNTTNIHTHGLHIDPSVDSVYVTIEPDGKSHTYNYKIPNDHAPGLHWYHAHKHGVTALHVMGGLFGAIYVEPKDTEVSSALKYFEKLQRILLILHHFSMDSINSDRRSAFRCATYPELSLDSSQLFSINATYNNSNLTDIYYTNGLFQPFLNVNASQEIIIDMLNASGDHLLEIDIRDSIDSDKISENCQITHIASDGVYFLHKRMAKFIVIPPAGRQSIILKCTKPGTYYMITSPDDNIRPEIAQQDTRFYQNLITLKVTSASKSENDNHELSNLNLTTIPRPKYLSDLTLTKPDSHWEIGFNKSGDIRHDYIGAGRDCSIKKPFNEQNKTCSYKAFDGKQGAGNRHLTFTNAVDQLVLNGGKGSPHTVHLHVNHFQIQQYIPLSPNDLDLMELYYAKIGDWRDSIPALQGRVVLRYNVNSFEGELMLHCHYLNHEDRGMMMSIISKNNGKECTFPDGPFNGFCTSESNEFTKHENDEKILTRLMMIQPK